MPAPCQSYGMWLNRSYLRWQRCRHNLLRLGGWTCHLLNIYLVHVINLSFEGFMIGLWKLIGPSGFIVLPLLTTKNDIRKDYRSCECTLFFQQKHYRGKEGGIANERGVGVGLFAFGWWILARKRLQSLFC